MCSQIVIEDQRAINGLVVRWREDSFSKSWNPLTFIWVLGADDVRLPDLHILPQGFVRMRHFGFLAYRKRAALLPLASRCWVRSNNRLTKKNLFH